MRRRPGFRDLWVWNFGVVFYFYMGFDLLVCVVGFLFRGICLGGNSSGSFKAVQTMDDGGLRSAGLCAGEVPPRRPRRCWVEIRSFWGSMDAGR